MHQIKMNIIGKKQTIGMLMLVFFMGLNSCKTPNIVQSGTVNSSISSKKIIKNHYKNALQFKTLRGKFFVDYKDGKEDQGHTVSFRMQRDNKIWLSAGWGVVKALITPEQLIFYNKLDQTYFEGDFAYLSQLLGTQLNFEKVQNLLIGQAIFDLTKERFHLEVSNNNYELKPKKEFQLFKRLFAIEPRNFKMALQQISQPEKERILEVRYPNYQIVSNRVFPEQIAIEVKDSDTQKYIDIQYKGLKFDEDLRFPFRIPSGYKQIEL